MLDFLQLYSGAFNFMATLVLVALTAFYVYWTKGILIATATQGRLTLNPVIGIAVKGISITEVFGPSRRNMNIDVELSNVGNAPAIEVLIDSEVELRYSSANGETVIPARLGPNMIPFLKPGDQVTGPSVSPGYGNTFITHFFDDVRESHRLNQDRLKAKVACEPAKVSRLRVMAYYRNSLGQYFRSYYEIDIGIWHRTGSKGIPEDNESCEVNMFYVPRPVFHAEPIDEALISEEMKRRDAKRKLSGW